MAKQIRNLVGLALLLATISASAQITHTIGVTVPFSFVAAGKNWTAGDYKVKINKHTGIVTLSSEGIASATLLTDQDERPGEVSRSYLRFGRYGDRWILREVMLECTAQILNSRILEKELTKLKPSGEKTLVAGEFVAR
jgi:hypothetical protein